MTDACLLVPYRATGLVSDGLPFAVAQLGTETFVATSIGHSFQVYACTNKLRQVFVGPQLQRAVTALGAQDELTIVACGPVVFVYGRAELLATLAGEHDASVRQVLCIGRSLLTVCDQGLLVAWSLPDGEVLARMHAGYTPTALAHPATYLNKVLLGAHDGRLQLWNLRSQSCVYEFAGWRSAVLTLEQSPALDVVGAGLADGRVVVHNLKVDRTVVTFAHDTGDACHALAFRTDGEPLLVTASASGQLYVWHLERRERVASLPAAHDGAIASAHFLRGRAELLTAGASDNALRMWSCDRAGGAPRPLRVRSGHAAPPVCVRFHADGSNVGGGAAGQAYLLSGGADRTIRLMSIWTSQQDCELSQRREERRAPFFHTSALERRLPPVLDVCSSMVRERDWPNALSCHVNSSAAYTWDTTTKALGAHVLRVQDDSIITAVAISACGSFGFLGTARGAVEKFNLQSGHRRAATAAADAHSGSVRGLATEALAQLLFSAGHDGELRVWRARDLAAEWTLSLEAPVTLLRHQRDTVLLAAACDDLQVRVVDAVTRVLVRRFNGHRNTITDLAWTPDARWLVSCSLDGTMRIVDLPSAQLIGWYSFAFAPTSVAVSPGGEYFATTHADVRAVCVWANRHVFSSVHFGAGSEKPMPLPMPAAGSGGSLVEASAETGEEDEEEEEEEEERGEEAEGQDDAPAEAPLLPIGPGDEQVHALLFTLSTLPAAHSKQILHLDAIKERNKVARPPKASEPAPFFLPTVAGVKRTFDAAAGAGGAAGAAANAAGAANAVDVVDDVQASMQPRSRFRTSLHAEHSMLARLLLEAEGGDEGKTTDASAILAHVQTLSPPALDLELRSLSAVAEGLRLMLCFFAAQLRSRRDVELTQACLALFIKIHADALVAMADELRAPLEAVHAAHANGWSDLQRVMHSACELTRT